MSSVENNNNDGEKEVASSEYVCEDPVILEAFADVKSAILAKRNDIVRQILSAAQSMREEDEYDSEGEERDKKELCDKYDSEEYIDLLSLLLSHKDTDSGTLLHYATRVDIADMARTLLAAGANTTIKNNEGRTPYEYCQSESMKNAYIGELMQAVSQSRTFRIHQLLHSGLDVNASDGARTGNTVLHWSASFSDLQTLQLILDKGADVNVVNSAGVTPLYDAINRADVTLVEELLKNGARLDIKPHKGKYAGSTPFDLASNNENILTLLNQYAEQEVVNQNGIHQDETNSEEQEGEVNHTSFTKEKLEKRLSTQSIQSTTSRVSILPTLQDVDDLCQYLCPPPQKIQQFNGLGFVPPKEFVVVITAPGNGYQIKNIFNIFERNFTNMGIKLNFQYTNDGLSNDKSSHLHCIINKHVCRKSEEYKIQFNTHKTTLISSCMRSFYRGLTTFIQCLQLYRGMAVPLLHISDWSNHPIRAAILDFGENDIPNMDILCETVNLFSFFKANQLQLNTAHLSSQANETYYSKEEFFLLQSYCSERFIQIVPYIKVDKMSSLLRLDNESLIILDEDILDKVLDQFTDCQKKPCFKKSASKFRLLHVDLCNLDISSPHLHQFHSYCLKRNILLQTSCSSQQFDVNLQQTTQLMNGFQGVVNINNVTDFEHAFAGRDSVCYWYWFSSNISDDAQGNDTFQYVDVTLQVKEMEEKICFYDNMGLSSLLCYDTQNFDRIYPNIFDITSNALQISTHLSKYNCDGFAIKLSYPSRRICNFSACISSLVITSSLGWNSISEFTTPWLENVLNYMIYEDDNDLSGPCFEKLGRAFPLSHSRLVFDEMLSEKIVDYSVLSNEMLQDICRIVKCGRQEMSKIKLHSPLMSFITEESSNILNLLFFLSRICYGLISLQPEVKNPDISNLTDVFKSDNSNRLMTLITEYEFYCKKYYKLSTNQTTTTSGLTVDYTAVSLLKAFLQKILPPSNTVETSGLFGVFTV